MSKQAQLILDYLISHGASSSASLQSALGVSQPTASRLLAGLADEIVVIGAGRQTRYAVARPIGKSSAQQAVWLIGEDGNSRRVGSVCLLSKDQILMEEEGFHQLFDATAGSPLPWLLSGLKAQGFLGRLLAKQIGADVVPSNPDLWNAEAALIGALHTHDAPGALRIGASSAVAHKLPKIGREDEPAQLDALAATIATSLPTGSSAGGEQPKFLARLERLGHVIVKFSPPLGTPFGERWKDLLIAESLASEALAALPLEVARNEIVQSPNRLFLVSPRFDRSGDFGRRHVVAIGDVHRAFCKGPYQNWAATCDELLRKGKLSRNDAETAHLVLQFGHLIGNTDMHSGNAALFVNGVGIESLLAGSFSFAPVYDMLPMRWKPDPSVGVFDYTPFEIDFVLAEQPALLAAERFWRSVRYHPLVSDGFKELASSMLVKFERN